MDIDGRRTFMIMAGMCIATVLAEIHARQHERENYAAEQRRYDREFSDIKSHYYRETA